MLKLIDDEDVLVDNTQNDNKDRKAYWVDYDELEVDNIHHSKYKWHDTLLQTVSSENGTSKPKNLQENLEKQTTLNFKKNGKNSIGTWKHDEKRPKKALLNLFVVGELSFKFWFCHAEPRFQKESPIIMLKKTDKLNKFFCNPLTNVHLTTDCWTSSCQ
uniref:Uncharacterized protein n=1 Tax=Lactuca sativa TaxID=4236 RepID=A0A9R1UZ28_LACSA|nr:hypothetical protein LSAT_V11C700352200 [Lactuca sativa]